MLPVRIVILQNYNFVRLSKFPVVKMHNQGAERKWDCEIAVLATLFIVNSTIAKETSVIILINHVN